MALKDVLPANAEPLFLVDGSSYLYRGFYAYPDLARSDGFPTNALYIILRIMLRLIREEKPRYLAFFLDTPGPTFRNEIFDAYKAQRQATPEALVRQVEPVKEAMALLGFKVLLAEGSESDDCIASLAARFKGQRPVVIMGSDKDLNQCLDQGVWLWDPGGKAEKLTSLASFQADTGLTPAIWPDYQALVGDSSDNIPGVAGVGPKTAAKLLTDHPGLEALREGLDSLPDKLRAKLAPHMDDAFRYRELTRLRTDLCTDLDLAALQRTPMDAERVRHFLETYEFRSLVREISLAVKADPVHVAADGGQFSLFASPAPAAPSPGEAAAAAPLAAPSEPAMEVIPLATAAELPDPRGREVAVVATTDGYRLGLRGKEYLFTGPAPELAQRLAVASVVYVPSVKELVVADPAWRAVAADRWFDLGLAAYLLNPEERDYGWSRLCRLYGADPDLETVAPGAEANLARTMGAALSKKLASAGMYRLMRDLEMPLTLVLADMEAAGVAIDLSAFQDILAEVSGRIEELAARVHELAGCQFNVRSSQQLADILYNRLGIKAKGKTPGGLPSTASEVLEKLDHPLAETVLEFRSFEKLRSTYLEPLPRLVDPKGRLHTTFNQLATATGRLSSSNPNLQNIPIRGSLGTRLRSCFTAAPGHLLAGADYSQIELRLLAHMSGCAPLIEAFKGGDDIHARTAALLYDLPQEQVTADKRRNAKTINFGLLYGMGPQRLAREMHISLTEAKAFVERYFAALPGIKEFFERIVRDAKAMGYVTTLSGRRRLLPEINSRNQNQEAQARRQAVNTRVQGSAADIIKMAMLQVHDDAHLRDLGARLILQVHDELLLEAPQATAGQAGERLRQLMAGVVRLSVPLVVDMGVGHTWAEAH